MIISSPQLLLSVVISKLSAAPLEVGLNLKFWPWYLGVHAVLFCDRFLNIGEQHGFAEIEPIFLNLESLDPQTESVIS